LTEGIDADKIAAALREKLIHNNRILLVNFSESGQEKDISSGINCEGFGRKHTPPVWSEKWIRTRERILPAATKLGVRAEEVSICQVFQVAGCNFRCWFCYLTDEMRQATCKAGYLTTDEMLHKLLKDPSPPRVLVLSGGSPDLVPEWLPLILKSIQKRNLENYFYVWWDTNLSTYFLWTYLSSSDWNLVKNFRNLGIQATLKGITPYNFYENTGVQPRYFYRQLDILSKLIRSGLDVYPFLTLTISQIDNIQEDVAHFMDLLQKIHPLLPLKTTPLEIKVYTPTRRRMNPQREQMLKNQYIALSFWLAELRKRFSEKDLSTPQPLIHLN
jgi:uncharacterized Fe-S cluster-containing radical SAM superfamily protein